MAANIEVSLSVGVCARDRCAGQPIIAVGSPRVTLSFRHRRRCSIALVVAAAVAHSAAAVAVAGKQLRAVARPTDNVRQQGRR